jgi:hypothetical protein
MINQGSPPGFSFWEYPNSSKIVPVTRPDAVIEAFQRTVNKNLNPNNQGIIARQLNSIPVIDIGNSLIVLKDA